MQLLCHYLKEDYDIGANFYLVGSGARNLILQNENSPIDLDYNLEIVRCEDSNRAFPSSVSGRIHKKSYHQKAVGLVDKMVCQCLYRVW